MATQHRTQRACEHISGLHGQLEGHNYGDIAIHLQPLPTVIWDERWVLRNLLLQSWMVSPALVGLRQDQPPLYNESRLNSQATEIPGVT